MCIRNTIYPPHFSPRAINADFNLSNPSDANSWKKIYIYMKGVCSIL